MRKLRINIFQHVVFEGIGAMESWLSARGHGTQYTRFFAGAAPPGPEEYDLLIVMGGPMGVHDEVEFPWLRAEKSALRAAIDAGRPVLGICLGAQLLAQVLGAEVSRNRDKEIGWFPVLAQAAHADQGGGKPDATWPAGIFRDRLVTFHWHGDTFTLPPGAVHLAASEGCRHQAFASGDRVIGLQFHPEATPAGIASLVEACAGDLVPGPYVQSVTALAGSPGDFAANGAFIDRLLTGLEARAFAEAQ